MGGGLRCAWVTLVRLEVGGTVAGSRAELGRFVISQPRACLRGTAVSANGAASLLGFRSCPDMSVGCPQNGRRGRTPNQVPPLTV